MKLDRSRIAWTVALLTFVSGGAVTLLGANTVQSSQDDTQQAQQAKQQPQQAQQQPQQAQQPVANAASSDAADDACLSDPAVLKEINQKKQTLDQRERDLNARETEIKARETAIGDEMKKLQSVRDEISGIQAARKQANAEKVAKVVATLEGMSPKAAAQMLTDLDDGLAVAAIAQMSTTKLSKVMNALDPQRAARLTELLAGVVRAKNNSASNGAAAATTITKGGESNGNKQPESIISGGPEQFTGRNTASAGQAPSGQ